MARIKHTPTEHYSLQNCYIGKSQLFKDVRRWYHYKSYKTKSGALKALDNIRRKYPSGNLVWRILWFPSPYANYEQSICVYNEEKEFC